MRVTICIFIFFTWNSSNNVKLSGTQLHTGLQQQNVKIKKQHQTIVLTPFHLSRWNKKNDDQDRWFLCSCGSQEESRAGKKVSVL